jgi:tetratricopeptide (TPR) repeat protein
MRLYQMLIILLALCLVPGLSRAADPQKAALAAKWVGFANAQYKAGKIDDQKDATGKVVGYGALKAYYFAFQADGTSGPAMQGLGNCYLRKGQTAQALQWYEYSLKVNPGNAALASYVAKLKGSAPVAAASSASTATTAAATGPVDWWAPTWRSLVVPGWGQWYNDQHTKAWILGGATWVCFAGTLGTYIIGSGAQAQYEGLTDPNADYNTPYNTWDQMATMNHIFYITWVALWTYDIVDAYLNAKPHVRTAEISYQSPVQLSLLPEGGMKMQADVLRF